MLGDIIDKYQLEGDADIDALSQLLDQKLNTIDAAKPGKLMSQDNIKQFYVDTLMGCDQWNEDQK